MNYPQGGNGWQQIPPPNMPPQPYAGQPYPGQPYAPGYYAPPPKKKMTWLWVLLALLVVVVLAVGGYVGFRFYGKDRDVTLAYSVIGTGTAQVSYTGGSSVKDVELPWAETVTLPSPGSFQVIARPGDSSVIVACTVSMDGEVIETGVPQGATGSSRVAICQGIVENR
ncbi:hypothetical protein ABQF34_24725 [Mycolicibacterium boenickei]